MHLVAAAREVLRYGIRHLHSHAGAFQSLLSSPARSAWPRTYSRVSSSMIHLVEGGIETIPFFRTLLSAKVFDAVNGRVTVRIARHMGARPRNSRPPIGLAERHAAAIDHTVITIEKTMETVKKHLQLKTVMAAKQRENAQQRPAAAPKSPPEGRLAAKLSRPREEETRRQTGQTQHRNPNKSGYTPGSRTELTAWSQDPLPT
jgi:hypothetical protein